MKDVNNFKKGFTIGEAVDMLMQDEDLKFDSGGLELYIHSAYGVVVFDIYTHELLTLNNNLAKRVWCIIPQPVNFVEAFQSGEKLR